MASVGARLRSRMAASGRSHHEDFVPKSSATATTTSATTAKAPVKSPVKAPAKAPTKTPVTRTLSAKDQRDVQTTFSLLDRDRDGQVGVDDVTTSLQELGCSVPRTAVQAFISKVTQGGSTMKESDLAGWVEGKGPATTTAVLQQAFTALDRDSDGFITQEDLEFGLNVTHENLSQSMLDLMFAHADTDQDGKIDIKDFLQALGEL